MKYLCLSLVYVLCIFVLAAFDEEICVLVEFWYVCELMIALMRRY